MGIRWQKTGWGKQIQSKYSNVSELYWERYPSEETTVMWKVYPHKKGDITKGLAMMVWLYTSGLLSGVFKSLHFRGSKMLWLQWLWILKQEHVGVDVAWNKCAENNSINIWDCLIFQQNKCHWSNLKDAITTERDFILDSAVSQW